MGRGAGQCWFRDSVRGTKFDARLIYNGIEAWFIIKNCIFEIFQEQNMFEKKKLRLLQMSSYRCCTGFLKENQNDFWGCPQWPAPPYNLTTTAVGEASGKSASVLPWRTQIRALPAQRPQDTSLPVAKCTTMDICDTAEPDVEKWPPASLASICVYV